jgi:hypothetical protein
MLGWENEQGKEVLSWGRKLKGTEEKQCVRIGNGKEREVVSWDRK